MHLYMLEADCLPSEKSQAHCQEEKAAIKKSKRWGEEKKKKPCKHSPGRFRWVGSPGNHYSTLLMSTVITRLSCSHVDKG